MSVKPLPRRTLLRGLVHGAPVAVALPALEAMLNTNGTAHAADGSPLPKRYGVFFWGGGVVGEGFFPTSAAGPTWEPSAALMPLAPHRDYVSILRNFKQSGGGLVHNAQRGWAVANSWKVNRTGSNGLKYGDPVAPSLDQIVAKAWAGKTRFDSIQVGIQNGGIYDMSWKEGYQRLPATTDPTAVFNRLFSGELPKAGTSPAPAAPQAPVLQSHKSVLDATIGDANRLIARLGGADKRRIEAHLQAIRDLEKRLQAPAAPVAAGKGCEKPALTGKAKGEAMAELVAMALACDLTRVFLYQWSKGQDTTVYKEVGLGQDYHTVTHDGSLYPSHGPKVLAMTMRDLGLLVGKLRATADGAGNLLDSLLMYVASEFLSGKDHRFDRQWFMLIGKAGGAVKNLGYTVWSNENQARVGLTTLHAVGVNAAGYGDQGQPYYVTDPLPGILA
jgi:hypothetical protein